MGRKKTIIQPKAYQQGSPYRASGVCELCGQRMTQQGLSRHVGSEKCQAFQRARELTEQGREFVDPITANTMKMVGYGNPTLEETGARTSTVDRYTKEYMNKHEYWADAWVVAIMSKYTSTFTHQLEEENEPQMMRELKMARKDPVLQKALVAERDLKNQDEIVPEKWDLFEVAKDDHF